MASGLSQQPSPGTETLPAHLSARLAVNACWPSPSPSPPALHRYLPPAPPQPPTVLVDSEATGFNGKPLIWNADSDSKVNVSGGPIIC